MKTLTQVQLERSFEMVASELDDIERALRCEIQHNSLSLEVMQEQAGKHIDRIKRIRSKIWRKQGEARAALSNQQPSSLSGQSGS